MKYLFTLLFVCLITTFSMAQGRYQDVVYLKNGSIIRGTIIEQVPNESIKIETADRSVFFYKMEEIEKFTKEPIAGRGKGPSTRDNISSRLGTGYIRIAELGYEAGVGTYGLDRLKLNFINSYQFNQHFSAGIGTGLRYYVDTDEVLLPVFADLRAIILDHHISPYVAFGFGYSFNLTDNFDGVGTLINPSAGVIFPVFEKSLLNVGLGYEVQRVNYTMHVPSYYATHIYYSSHYNTGALSLHVGLTF